MKIFHESRVEPSDIDNLGHMNVRVYARHASAGIRALANEMGLTENALQEHGVRLEIQDAHTRFQHEQLEGAPLGVRAGVLDADSNGIATYAELYNRETERLSATFRKVLRLTSHDDRTPLPFNGETLSKAEALKIDWPEHGKPRSISLEPMRDDTTIADMDSRGIEQRFDGYTVTEDDATDDGYMDLSDGPWLAFAKMPIKFKPKPEQKTDSWFTNGKISIATLESRQVIFEVPKVSDTVISYTGIADIQKKTMQFRHWSFDQDTGKLLSVLAEIGIGLDLEARKSCEFPPDMRAKLEEQANPELV